MSPDRTSDNRDRDVFRGLPAGGTVLSATAKLLAAAQWATQATSEILRCLREEDLADEDVLLMLLYAARLVIETQDRPEDNQLAGAIETWTTENT